MADRVNDLLLPIVKGVGSERAWVLLGTESLQTFGGSGFLQDYPIEQYVRDAKIDTLYEGTTAIQGLDFFFRKIVRDKGQALAHVAMQIQEFAKDLGAPATRSATERELLGKAPRGRPGHPRLHGRRADEVRPAPRGGDVANLYKVGPEHHPAAAGRRRPRRRLAAAAPGRGRARRARRRRRLGQGPRLLRGQGRGRAFFAATSCPGSPPSAPIAEATDNALMDVPESAF